MVLLGYFSRASSACKEQFQRLLSFGSVESSSNNGNAEETNSASRTTQSDHDAQDGGGPAASPRVEHPNESTEEEEKPSYKRVGKVAQSLALFMAGTAVALFVNQPAWAHTSLLICYTAFVYIAFCTGSGLSIYSIFRKPSPSVACVQKKMMVVGFGSLLVALIVRTINILSRISSGGLAWFVLLLGVPVVTLSALIAWKREGGNSTAAAAVRLPV